MSELKYKVGDRVKYGSEICTVTKILESQGKFKYRVQSDTWFDIVNEDEMIEGLVEEETLIERVDDNGLPFNEWLSHKGAFYIPDGYELKDEHGNEILTSKIILEKKKKEVTYPKTYEECSDVLGELADYCWNGYKGELFRKFHMLIICRDAYWKIAGEEMGLGKPWEPDYLSDDYRYCIVSDFGKIIKNAYKKGENHIFAFPTAEMRDAFYENFDPDLEICKEFL